MSVHNFITFLYVVWFGFYWSFLVQAFTQLDEEDHGHGGAEATHALAEVVTTIGHVAILSFTS